MRSLGVSKSSLSRILRPVNERMGQSTVFQEAQVLYRMIYASTSTTGMSANDIQLLVSSSRTYNRKNDLTGVLAYNGRYFLHGLEGDGERLSELLIKILNDRRHIRVRLFRMEEIRERIWTEWAMGFAAPGPAAKEAFLRHSVTANFYPYILNADSAERLLSELSLDMLQIE
jgi:hypothetical protein